MCVYIYMCVYKMCMNEYTYMYRDHVIYIYI